MKIFFSIILMTLFPTTFVLAAQNVLTCGHILESQYIAECNPQVFGECGLDVGVNTVIEPWFEMWLTADQSAPATNFIGQLSKLLLFSDQDVAFDQFEFNLDELIFNFTTTAGEDKNSINLGSQMSRVVGENLPGSVFLKGDLVYSVTSALDRGSETFLTEAIPFACLYQ